MFEFKNSMFKLSKLTCFLCSKGIFYSILNSEYQKPSHAYTIPQICKHNEYNIVHCAVCSTQNSIGKVLRLTICFKSSYLNVAKKLYYCQLLYKDIFGIIDNNKTTLKTEDFLVNSLCILQHLLWCGEH